jgi:hypothetical protein
VRYSGNILSVKFVDDGIEIQTTWSHPLSRTRTKIIAILDIVTGDYRVKSREQTDVMGIST